MTLKDDLQDIDGVGPATADKIVSIVDEHGHAGLDPQGVDHAIEQARRGNEGAVIDFLETLR